MSAFPQQSASPSILPAGAINFRDLGGWRGAGGRLVRSGRVYRTGATHLLSAEARRQLDALGIAVVVDLRSGSERRRNPHALARSPVTRYWVRSVESASGDVMRTLAQGERDSARLRERMLELYRQLPFTFADAFGHLLSTLADGTTPVAFNCAAGKDRTGVGAALLLTALGVSRDGVGRDYLRTNDAREALQDMFRGHDSAVWRKELGAELEDTLLGAHPEYLAAMFEAIDARHDTMEEYFRQVLGVDAGCLANLRHHLLED